MYGISSCQTVTQLNQAVVFVVDHCCKEVFNERRFFGAGVSIADVILQRLVVEGVAQADPSHLVVPQREHIAAAVHDVAEMPLTVPAPDVVEEAQHIGLVRVQSAGGGDGLGRGLRAAGRGEIDDERLAVGSGGGRGGLGRCGPAAAGGEAQQHDRAGQHGDELFHGDASSVVDGRDPAVNGLVRRAQGRVVEVHVEARFHVRARAQRRHVLERAAKPAAVRGEGVDGLATEVVRGQERARGRGAGVPPDGRAEHDRIVAVKVDVHRLELRQEAALDLLLALRDHIVI